MMSERITRKRVRKIYFFIFLVRHSKAVTNGWKIARHFSIISSYFFFLILFFPGSFRSFLWNASQQESHFDPDPHSELTCLDVSWFLSETTLLLPSFHSSSFVSQGKSFFSMAHLRRFHYQSKGRCCSTPAVASLPDFSDSYFEEIKVSYFLFCRLWLLFS